MVTQQDIANFLKVPKSTVSVALNDDYKSKRISAKRREYIKSVARDMGYVVDDMARALATGKSNVIGLLCSCITEQLLRGITVAAAEHDFLVKILPVEHLQHSKELFLHIRKIIRVQRLCGLIMHYPENETLTDYLLEEKLPCLITSVGGTVHPHIARIHPDNERGGMLAAKHLLELGHRNFLCVSWGRRHTTGRNRLAGFLETIDDYDGTIEGLRLIQTDSDTLRQQKIETILKNPGKRPTAIFSVNDGNAVGALVTALRLGLKVPDDVSIVGYGNNPMGVTINPALTTVEEHLFKVGKKSFMKLMGMIVNGDAVKDESCSVDLVVRESTGKAPTGKPLK